MNTELPLVREPTDKELATGISCQNCEKWLDYKHSYGSGVCVLAGINVTPRWTTRMATCDQFEAKE